MRKGRVPLISHPSCDRDAGHASDRAAPTLPLAPGAALDTFGASDALLNVEASHLYDNPARFFAEAFRVLVEGGMFFHVDLAWKDKDPPAMIAAAGFEIVAVEDITQNVVQALDLDSVRREAIVMSFPEALRKDFRDWSGVKDFRAYNRLKTGEWIYRITRARR